MRSPPASPSTPASPLGAKTMSRTTSSVSNASVASATTNDETNNKNNNTVSGATQSLQLLLRDDHLLVQHELHVSKHSQEAAFSYAAALLGQQSNNNTNNMNQHVPIQQRATLALSEVERKLALVQSLAERVSRTSPKAVAGPLLRLHGYTVLQDEDQVLSKLKRQQSSTIHEGNEDDDNYNDNDDETKNDMDDSLFSQSSKQSPPTTFTLVATRDRCHRLLRQSEVLEGVAKRVEHSLERGLVRMDTATSRLARVLALSSTLKMILRLQFEASKLQGYDLDDTRDLTRAAASVAIVEDLLQKLGTSSTSTSGGSSASTTSMRKEEQPSVVLQMKPAAHATATKVREAAKALLEQHYAGTGVVQLGATLQVYYHLGELPHAAWSAVQFGLEGAQTACHSFWNPTNITRLVEEATLQAKATSKTESALQRNLAKLLTSRRRDATMEWATTVSQSALQVWNLHRVLSRKTDPVSRKVFLSVVAEATIPPDLVSENFAKNSSFSVFTIFWDKFCKDLGEMLQDLLKMDKVAPDVSALYPAVRSAVLHMLGRLYDTMQAGTSQSSMSLDDATSSSSNGILGGSSALDTVFSSDDVSTSIGVTTADTWTRVTDTNDEDAADALSSSTTSLSAIFNSSEWKSMQLTGLYPLQTAFLDSCRHRLCTPIQFMFPEGLAVDEDGVAMQVLPTLPSRYDMQKLDHSIRTELSLADPREGGGDLSMTTMIAQVVVDMVERFCARAKTAVTEAGEEGYLLMDTVCTPSKSLVHDLKVANIMNTLATTLKNAPENTFVVPYRPATSPQHEEAATLCSQSLAPALLEVDRMVKNLILTPLCRALNRRIATAISKMHHGTYLESSLDAAGAGDGPSFVQKQLVGLYEAISQEHLSNLPPDHAAMVASTIASFSIYTFVSNASLIRPLGETARLHITQDLAEFELALEQLVLKGGGSMTLAHIGKPYAELRAVRQMFYWTGLDQNGRNAYLSASVIAKSILREVWAKDVRPSTVFHFLFSFAPDLLSSPHHSKRMRPEEYVSTLVKLDGSIDEGEVSAWMTTMACCDAYQQRESVVGMDGDKRVAAILMMLGPELLRRRRH